MSTQTLSTAIFQRKSVRKYAPEPLSTLQLAELQEYMAGLPSLSADNRVALRLLAPTQISRGIRAPHYVAAYAGTDKLSMLGVGYRLEYMGLHLVSLGLGSCYNGMAAPHASCATWHEMPAAMVMAMGTPAGEPRRTGPMGFKRKRVEDICSESVPKTLAEAVRVAPSSVNCQPWYLGGDKDAVDVFYAPRFLASKMPQGMAYVNMGIALAHLELAAKRQKMGCSFDFSASPTEPLGRRGELICRATFIK